MFWAPWVASCLPLIASSCWLIVIVKPGTVICDSASATPFAVGTPFGASPPVIGSSIPILMAVPPPPPPPPALPAGVLLHAAAKMVAAATAAPTRANFMNSSSKLPSAHEPALPKAGAAPVPLVAGLTPDATVAAERERGTSNAPPRRGEAMPYDRRRRRGCKVVWVHPTPSSTFVRDGCSSLALLASLAPVSRP